jgi:hypothetical protein
MGSDSGSCFSDVGALFFVSAKSFLLEIARGGLGWVDRVEPTPCACELDTQGEGEGEGEGDDRDDTRRDDAADDAVPDGPCQCGVWIRLNRSI